MATNTNLIVDCNAQSLASTHSHGDNVAAWDIFANAGATKPIFHHGLSGPTVWFDQTDFLSATPDWSAHNNFELFVVQQVLNSGGTCFKFWSTGDNSHILFTDAKAYDGSFSTARKGPSGAASGYDGKWPLLTRIMSKSASYALDVYDDRSASPLVSMTSGTNTVFSPNGGQTVGIGKVTGATVDAYTRIKRLLIYASADGAAISTGDRASIIAALQADPYASMIPATITFGAGAITTDGTTPLTESGVIAVITTRAGAHIATTTANVSGGAATLAFTADVTNGQAAVVHFHSPSGAFLAGGYSVTIGVA